MANQTSVNIYVKSVNNPNGIGSTKAVINWAKLEKGTKPTDWTPAPEDMATAKQISELTVDLESITGRVEDAEGNISTLKQTSTGFEARLETAESNASTAKTNASTALSTANTAKSTADTANSNANTAKTNASNALTTANAAKKQVYHSASGTSGTAGYVRFAQVKFTNSYMNRPVYFALSNRGQNQSNVWIRWANASNSDPALSSITADGGINVWVHKTDTSTWEVVAQKSKGYDTIYVNDYSNNNGSGCAVTWVNAQLSSVPSGSTQATRIAAKRNSADIDDAAKTATNYLKFDSSGLVVGNVAGTLQGNTQITSTGVNIRNGSTTLASFGSSQISLGKNSDSARITLCNDQSAISGYSLSGSVGLRIAANSTGVENNGYIELSKSAMSRMGAKGSCTPSFTVSGVVQEARNFIWSYIDSSGRGSTVSLGGKRCLHQLAAFKQPMWGTTSMGTWYRFGNIVIANGWAGFSHSAQYQIDITSGFPDPHVADQMCGWAREDGNLQLDFLIIKDGGTLTIQGWSGNSTGFMYSICYIAYDEGRNWE